MMRIELPRGFRTSFLFALTTLLASLAACTSPERCAIGSVGCSCDVGNSCDGASVCGANNRCNACTPGTAGCICDVGNSCDGASVCGANNRCNACTPGTAGCICDTSDTCNGGLLCTVDHRCEDAATVVCFDACQWNFDGICDDGGPGAAYAACEYGSDCTDCLARPNTCTDPNYPTFCPNTASTSDGPCWGPNIDCDSIAMCNGLNYGCGSGYSVACDTLGNATCEVNPCASNSWNRRYCAAFPLECFASLTECSTVIDCGGVPNGCFVGEISSCDTSNVFDCQ